MGAASPARPSKSNPGEAAPGSRKAADPDPVLGETLLEATRAMVAIATRALAAQEDQVTIVQFRALVVLASNEPCNLSTLSDALDVHASTATRMCDRLVARNYVERVRSRDSRREVQLTLTDDGRRIVDSETKRRREQIARIVAAIDEADRPGVAAGLQAFLAASRTVLGDTWPESLSAAGDQVAVDRSGGRP
jgi:DNA-binding MarR family transcriptional regulator